MKAAVQLLTLLAVAAQTSAAPGGALVCRFTGEPMDDACPELFRGAAPAAEITPGSCCEVRETAPKAEVAISQKATPESPAASLAPIALPAFAVEAAPPVDTGWLRAGAGPPYGAARYLSLRQLLI